MGVQHLRFKDIDWLTTGSYDGVQLLQFKNIDWLTTDSYEENTISILLVLIKVLMLKYSWF